ncbi:uncharacterized protein LOC111706355 isoform X2 [Eurytemora carolleeae]|uniref:uncharacterized protein LOC111706355 isoform X2 n=1 Tax=Eurytemora carolleeae TaxID=1294199 RepID=UPI000C78EFBB|nr:uncharacterized protein LOC111706355 isoform X2 [Eurytemora carolleeae]|eukprot:XP_023334981.1 uncharacterized protein LOC111706355 isoform X2 [Eurytemora affinis]
MGYILAASLNNWEDKLASDQENQVTAVAVRPGQLCLGYSTGFIKLFYRTKSEHLSLHWAKGILPGLQIEHLGFNDEETYLVVAGGQHDTQGDNVKKRGVGAIVDVLSGELCWFTDLLEEITSVCWVGHILYIGGKFGSVCLVDTKESNIPPAKQILALDSEVVQIAGDQDLLVCSTLTRAVVCNHKHKSYREIGSKLRQGKQGVAVHGGRVWSARPGCRLWEVDVVTGNVLATRQYRRIIHEHAENPVYGCSIEDKKETKEISGIEHGFSLLMGTESTLVSWNEFGYIYILEMTTSTVLAWTKLNFNIKSISGTGSILLVLLHSGDLIHLTFGTLEFMLESSYSIDMFESCADLLVQNRKLIRTLSQNDLRRIMKLKDLSSRLRDQTKAKKVFKLMDAVERLGLSLERLDNRSLSQDRNSRLHSSSEVLRRDEIKSSKSQSQEDLLDGGKRWNRFRDLSGSRRKISASEQGLQALQLYDIKFGARDSLSGASSIKSSVDSLINGRCDVETADNINQATEKLKERLEEQAREAGIYINVNQNYEENSTMLLHNMEIDQKSEDNGGEILEIVEDENVLINQEDPYACLDLLSQNNRIKKPQEETNGVESRDRYKVFELITEPSRMPEERFGEGPIIPSMQETSILGDVLVSGMEILLERGGKILEGGSHLSSLMDGTSNISRIIEQRMEKRMELDSPRLGLSRRIQEELRGTELQSKVDELARLFHQIYSNPEFRLANTKSLGNALRELFLDFKKENDDVEYLDISGYLTDVHKVKIMKGLEAVFSNPSLVSRLFSPLHEAEPWATAAPDYIYQQLIPIFTQSAVDFDLFIAKTLVSFSEMLPCDKIVENLDVTNYYTYKYILSVDAEMRKELSPIMLEQIDLENVFSCANFLAGYQDIELLNLVRYLERILSINSECCIHIIQSQTLILPPSCLLFHTFKYLEYLYTSISIPGCVDLMSELETEWFSYFCRALAVHIPGWPREWSDLCKQHPSFFNFINQAFKATNLSYLNKYPNIKGSHKSLENLELFPLANFLMIESGLTSPPAQLAWSKLNSFMPSYARCMLVYKKPIDEEIPLLIELGDSDLLADLGLLSAECSMKVAEHILQVYIKDECPLTWNLFSECLLRCSGPVITFQVLLKLSPLLKPGDIEHSFYCKLLVSSLQYNRAGSIADN